VPRPLLLAALGGGLAALLAGWLVLALRAAWRRGRDRARLRRGHAGERRGRALLEAAGWRVLAAHPPGEIVVAVDGARRAQPLAADYLCERRGRVLPAEVKTGGAADLATSATRRQLLEYAVAYRAGATLFVDADRGTVAEVTFTAGAAGRPRWRSLAVGIALGVAAGLAAGWAAFGAGR
jgi:hypothetical protein